MNKAKVTIARALTAGLIGSDTAKSLNVEIMQSDINGRVRANDLIEGLQVKLQQLSEQGGE